MNKTAIEVHTVDLPPASASGRWLLVSRVVASLLGVWVFSWGVVSLGITLLVAAGMAYSEARTLLFLLVFLLFLALFCWAIAAPSLKRVWWLLGGGGVLMTAAAWLLSRALTG